MDWDTEPNLKEFTKVFREYVDDIGIDNNPHGFIASHNIIGRIRVEDADDDETYYNIVGLDMDQLGGCGCTAGIIIRIKKETL